jgi:hypothetical protein
VAWFTTPKLLLLLPTLQFVIMYGLWLLHSLEELNYQVVVLLYLLEFVTIYAPLPIPKLQLAPSMCQYH